MFGIGYSELLVIAIVGLVVIGPKDLPRVMRQVGRWVGRAQTMARHFRSGIDTMMREAELEEMEKKWREENERIMADHPPIAPPADDMLAAPASDPEWVSAAASPVAGPAPDPAAPELPFAATPAPPVPSIDPPRSGKELP
jgi:sec-independent protein translocase protein TatB